MKLFRRLYQILSGTGKVKAHLSGNLNSELGTTARGTLISPCYDHLTRWLNALVGGFCEGRRLLALPGEGASKENLATFLSSERSTSTCIVFVGHGKESYLLTAPNLGVKAEEFDGVHSILLEQDDISTPDLAVFAYACNAGSGMGSYARSIGAFFIGYDGDLPFIPNDGYTGFDEVFARPVGIAVEDFEQRGVVDFRTFQAIKAYYTDALEQVKARRGDPRCRAVVWALKLHRELISAKGGN